MGSFPIFVTNFNKKKEQEKIDLQMIGYKWMSNIQSGMENN